MKKLIFFLLLIPCFAVVNEGKTFTPNIVGVIYTVALYSFYAYTNFGKSVIKTIK